MDFYSKLAGLALASASTLKSLVGGDDRRIATTRRKKNASRQECGLDIILPSSTSPEIDICFVHGTTGDRRSTWTGNDGTDVFWPQDLLQQDSSLPAARILLYGYNTDVNSLCWLTRRTLYHHAHHFLNDLAKARHDCEDRPLLFISHSLGGILVKSALIFACDARSSTSPMHVGRIFLSTFGIVSFGSPHTHPGSRPLDEIIDRLCQLPDNLNSMPRTGELEDFASGLWKEDVKFLRIRLDRYKAIATQIPEIFCYESKGLPQLGLIAPPATVVPRKQHFMHKSCQTICIPNDHINMTKFTKSTPEFADICNAMIRLYDASKASLSRRRTKLSGADGDSAGKKENSFNVPSILPNRDETLKFVSLPIELEHEPKGDEPLVITDLEKSKLVAEFAYRNLERFSCIFWVRADNVLSLESSFERIGHRIWESDDSPSSPGRADLEDLLGINSTRRRITSKKENHEMVVRFVLDWLAFKDNNNWLLIFDQVDDIEGSLKDYFPVSSQSHGRVIIIGRPGFLHHRKSVQAPALDDSAVFLGPGRPRQSSPSLRIPLSRSLQTLPPPSSDPDGKISKSSQSVIRDSDIDVAHAGSFALSIEDFSSSDPDVQAISNIKSKPALDTLERTLIMSCIMLSALPIPAVIARIVLRAQYYENSGVVSRLEALHAANWIHYDSDLHAFEIPKAVRTNLKLELDDKQKVYYAQQACNLVQQTISELSEDSMFEFERRIAEAQLLPHASACFNLYQEFGPSIKCEWDAIAELCERCDRFSDSARFYHLALGQDSLRPESHSQLSKSVQSARIEGVYGDILRTSSTLVSVESFNSQLDDAHSEPVDLTDAKQESQKLRRLRCRVGLIRVRVQLSKQDEPEETDTSPNNIETDASGNEDVEFLLEDTSSLDMDVEIESEDDIQEPRIDRLKSGQIDPNEELEKECRAIIQRVQNRKERHYRELRSEALRQLILIECGARKWNSAIKHNQKLVEILEVEVGPSDSQTLSAIRQLAQLYMDQGVFYEAELLLDRVLITYEQELGISAIRTISALQLLARCCRAQGNLRRASELSSRVVTIVGQRLGVDHIETAKAKVYLAQIYDAAKNGAESERLFEEALAAAKQLGEENAEYRRIHSIYQARKRE